jgi:hypothetical protein
MEACSVVRCEGSHIFLDNWLTDGGEVVSLMCWLPLTPRKISGTHFCCSVRWDFGYCGHYWPIVPALNERWWWKEDWQEKPKYSEKTCRSATLSTTNPTWLDPGLNPGSHGGKPVTNRLSYNAAISDIKVVGKTARIFWFLLYKKSDKSIPDCIGTSHYCSKNGLIKWHTHGFCKIQSSTCKLRKLMSQGLGETYTFHKCQNVW